MHGACSAQSLLLGLCGSSAERRVSAGPHGTAAESRPQGLRATPGWAMVDRRRGGSRTAPTAQPVAAPRRRGTACRPRIPAGPDAGRASPTPTPPAAGASWASEGPRHAKERHVWATRGHYHVAATMARFPLESLRALWYTWRRFSI